MTIGTVHRNLFHRMGDAWNAFKALPSPGELYPQQQGIQSGFLTFPGWTYLEQNTGQDRDLTRAKTALQSPWVYSNLQALAREVSTAELVVKIRKGDKLEDVDNHPLEVLWQAPNRHMGCGLMMEFWAQSYAATGKAFLYWLPDTSGSLENGEVWPIPPFMIKPIPGDDFIQGYAFKSSPTATPIGIPAENITYSHSVNLFDLRDGLSFLAATMTEIQGDLAAAKWNLNYFDTNNGIPDGLISVDKNTLDQDLQRVRMELRDFYGGPKRGVAVARAGELAYTPFGRSQKDMEFLQGREFASKVVGRALGFPDGYWSDLANKANAEQARATMIAGAVWPLLVRLAEDMNAKEIGVVQRWFGPDYRVEFKDIRIEDRQLKMQETALRKDYWLINELREADGKDPLDDVRGLMLIAEIAKGMPTPGSEPAQELDDQQAEKDKAAAAAQAKQDEAQAQQVADQIAQQGGTADALNPPAAEQPPAPPQTEAPPMPGMKTLHLELWEKKALKALRRFHKASVPFESTAIPLPEQARITEALKSAQTADDVRAAFKADTTDSLIDDVEDEAIAWATEAQGG